MSGKGKSLVGLTIPERLEQTAVTAPRLKSPAQPADPRLTGGQLHTLSIEHAAIAAELSETELRLVLALGTGMGSRKVAVTLDSHVRAVDQAVERLKKKTRMSRLSLAVLGYQLAGQVDTWEWQKVAA